VFGHLIVTNGTAKASVPEWLLSYGAPRDNAHARRSRIAGADDDDRRISAEAMDAAKVPLRTSADAVPQRTRDMLILLEA
jgi:hypothetical protein